MSDFSLVVPAAKTTALIGATGSGKSTVVKLMLRFYEPDSGAISIDKVSIKDLSLNALRESIGMVSQEAFLFEGSIAQNIAYGRVDATTDQIRQAATAAEAGNL